MLLADGVTNDGPESGPLTPWGRVGVVRTAEQHRCSTVAGGKLCREQVKVLACTWLRGEKVRMRGHGIPGSPKSARRYRCPWSCSTRTVRAFQAGPPCLSENTAKRSHRAGAWRLVVLSSVLEVSGFPASLHVLENLRIPYTLQALQALQALMWAGTSWEQVSNEEEEILWWLPAGTEENCMAQTTCPYL